MATDTDTDTGTGTGIAKKIAIHARDAQEGLSATSKMGLGAASAAPLAKVGRI